MGVSLLALTSCDVINEEMPECAPPPKMITKVNFVYDYNMQKEDLINDHVGSVYLYVFDENGLLKRKESKHKTYMRRNPDFSMEFTSDEIEPGKTYEFIAVAQGNWAGYESSLETPGFVLQKEMNENESYVEDFLLKLDSNDDGYYDFGIVNYKDTYGKNKEMMDTLWSTKPDETQIVHIPYITYKPSIEQMPDIVNEVTIPLMRITNSITVNLVSNDFDADSDVDAYNILIDFPNGNGTIDFTGTTYPAQELLYRSLRKNMTKYVYKNNGAQYDAYDTEETKSRADDDQYAIQAVFGVSRMQTTDGSSLQVRDAETNEIIVKIGGDGDESFSQWLANYFDNEFDDQEFLDREYDFTVDIHLTPDNDGVAWYQIGCAILGWGRRIQIVDF